MYKLFLTIRYLTRKAIVIFPILVVWLCVAMMIIVTSIMGGFVDRVRQANRELMGDVIVESQSRAGWSHYDELAKILGKLDFIEVTTPVVRAYGLFNVGRANAPVQVIGLEPVGRAKVSRFQQSLYRQYAAPRDAVDDLSKGGYPVTGAQLVERATRDQHAAREEFDRLEARDATMAAGGAIADTSWNFAWAFLLIPMLLLEWLLVALTRDTNAGGWRIVWWAFPAAAIVATVALMALPTLPHAATAADKEHLEDAYQQNTQLRNRATRAWQFAERLPADKRFNSRSELSEALVPKLPSFEPYPAPATFPGEAPPPPGCIAGVDLGLYQRDRRGNYDRSPFRDNVRGILTVAPIVPGGGVLFTPQQQQVRVVDDSYSKVFDVDSTYVYIPFDVAQKLALMTPWEKEDGTGMTPARISELQIKVKNGDDPAALEAAKQRIKETVDELIKKYPQDLSKDELQVQTWDEKQAKYIAAVVNEKRMITFILALMSLVVEVVIFLIFYMIVRDKTRDIGIIKAIGGSASGVAAIFIMYGLLVGVVGGALGVALGVEFVWHTNEIHEWIYQTTGILIWNRSVYLFDRIPDVVNWYEVSLYFAAAVLSGVVGAKIPALRAGRQDPVKAVRYE